jgi:hypothetical protein
MMARRTPLRRQHAVPSLSTPPCAAFHRRVAASSVGTMAPGWREWHILDHDGPRPVNGIGGDGRTVKFDLQAAVERDPQPPSFRFTRHPADPPLSMATDTLAVHSRFMRQRRRSM